jgi:ABC-type uncharacterized transport system permease subunit
MKSFLRFNLYKILFFHELREQYPTKLAYLLFFVGSLLELIIYSFTSKAIGPNAVEYGNYFQFVVTGQLVLFLPIHLLGTFVFGIRDAQNKGILEPILLLPKSLNKKLIYLAAPNISRSVLHILIFSCFAFLLFGLHWGLETTLRILLLQILFLPLFLSIGIFSAGIYLWHGRGANSLHLFSQGLAILAGVYFPTSLFPDSLEEVTLFLSPFNLILDLSRTPMASWGWNLFALILWSVILLPMAQLVLTRGYLRFRMRGRLDFANSPHVDS